MPRKSKTRETKGQSISTKAALPKNILPLFIVTVCVVFSFLFTVLMIPLGVVESDIKIIFVMMLVASTTVASTVALVFFLFFEKRV